MRKYIYLFLSVIAFSCTIDNDVLNDQGIEDNHVLELKSTKSSNTVNLVKAWNSYSYYRGFSTWTRKFTVRVSNLAYDKKVSIYHEKVDGSWEEIALSYNCNIDDQNEIWTGKYEYSGYTTDRVFDDEFVVKYDVNGTTYWDNNNDNNYVIGEKEIGSLFAQQDLNVNVDFGSLYPYYSGGNIFNVVADVRNIDPNKEVEVVYTTDGWQTKQYLQLEFTPRYYSGYAYVLISPNQFNIERWTGSVIVDSLLDEIEYVVVYKVNGEEYWDNNYGKNYIVNTTN